MKSIEEHSAIIVLRCRGPLRRQSRTEIKNHVVIDFVVDIVVSRAARRFFKKALRSPNLFFNDWRRLVAVAAALAVVLAMVLAVVLARRCV
jgi:hypothetical protein